MYEDSENIRPADPIIKECLLSGSNYPSGRFIPYNQEEDEDAILQKILEQSAIEYEMREVELEIEREQNRMKEREERAKHFASLKLKFQQLHRLDPINSDFYKALISYIESYESGQRFRVEVDDKFYEQFTNILHNMRTNSEEKRRILAFICISP